MSNTLRLTALCLLFVTASCGKSPEAATDWDQPIIVLISLDCVRADALSCYGNPRKTTPNIDALAHDGARFKTAYANVGYTPPSHASMFSGLYPHRHGLGTINKFFDDVPLLAEVLKAKGFVTSASVVSPPLQAEYGFDRGFDRYYTGLTSDARIQELQRSLNEAQENDKGAFVFLHYFDAHSNYSGTTHTVGMSETVYDAPAPFEGSLSSSLVAKLDWSQAGGNANLDFVRRNLTGKPLLQEQNAYLRARFDECVAYLDFETGRIIEALKEKKLYDRATLIVTADHGEFFGEHRLNMHGSNFEEGVRVPLVIKPPKAKQNQAIEVDGLAELVDLFPTVLDAAEVVYPLQGLDGASLWACATGKIATAPKTSVFGTFYGMNSFLRKGKYKIVRIMASHRQGQYLFDLDADPKETNNLIAALPDVALTMNESLNRELERSYAPLVIAVVYGGETAKNYQLTLSTDGRFQTETILDETYAFRLATSTEKRIVVRDQLPALSTFFTISSAPVNAEITLAIEVDGVPMPKENIHIGSRHAMRNGAARFRCADPEISGLAQVEDWLEFAKQPQVFIYRCTQSPSRRYKLSKDTRELMKQLGYF